MAPSANVGYIMPVYHIFLIKIVHKVHTSPKSQYSKMIKSPETVQKINSADKKHQTTELCKIYLKIIR